MALRLLLSNRPEQTFPQFWNAYPRKVAKKDATKAWVELDPDDVLIAQILAALAWQRELWLDLMYVPYPATYLRAERWTDEPPVSVREQKRQQGTDYITALMRDRERET